MLRQGLKEEMDPCWGALVNTKTQPRGFVPSSLRFDWSCVVRRWGTSRFHSPYGEDTAPLMLAPLVSGAANDSTARTTCVTLTPSPAAIYFASSADRATTRCVLPTWLTTAPPRVTSIPVVERLSVILVGVGRINIHRKVFGCRKRNRMQPPVTTRHLRR